MPQLFRPPRPLPAPLDPSMPCPPPPPPLFRPPRPFPAPVEPSPPLGPAWMPPPLLAAVKKMRLLPLSYAVDRAWGMAMIGSMPLSIWLFDSFPEEARFWIWLYLCLAAAMVVITCVNISYDPRPQQVAPAAEVEVLLPPPPPEMDMDMC